jgi:hypothetical protein
MGAGPLSARVLVLCHQVEQRLGGVARSQVHEIRGRLGEPLRLAVAGRLKAGKSTLVNAMIGRRVAPTEVGECTRVVTQFRYGTSDRVDVVRRDGTRVSRPLDGAGMIPQRLGVARQDIAYVDVTLTSDHLRDLTVVDTPGLSSVSTGVSAAARRYLFNADSDPAAGRADAAPFDRDIDDDLDAASTEALSGAEAIIYVLTQSLRADDVAALEAFRSVTARLSSTPVNALGLFTKVDKLAPGGADPWPTAARLAAEQATTLRRTVSDVVPVIGLLAETTEAGRLTNADGAALRALAALPPAELAVLLASVDLFTTRPCVVPTEARARLALLLDLYGVAYAVAHLRERPQASTGELAQRLLQASGWQRLRHSVDTTFRWRADAIKAGWALSGLERIAGNAERAADRESLRDAIQRVLAQPEYHRLRLLEVARLVTTGVVELPAPMEAEVTRLAMSEDTGWILGLQAAAPAELARAALDAAGRWRAYGVGGASPAQARVAMVVHRGFHLLAQRVAEQTQAR